MRRVKHFPATETRVREVLREVPHMSEATKPSPKGSDWTRLLTDPDLVSHLGKLLQTYREVSPEEREPALLRAMREIKTLPSKPEKHVQMWRLPRCPRHPLCFNIPNRSMKRPRSNRICSPRN